MAAGKKTGGRKRGTKNKRVQAVQAAIAESGLLPVDYLLQVMRDETVEQSVRLGAAKDVAPYVHPRLASIEHAGKGGGPIHVNISGDDAGLL